MLKTAICIKGECASLRRAFRCLIVCDRVLVFVCGVCDVCVHGGVAYVVRNTLPHGVARLGLSACVCSVFVPCGLACPFLAPHPLKRSPCSACVLRRTHRLFRRAAVRPPAAARHPNVVFVHGFEPTVWTIALPSARSSLSLSSSAFSFSFFFFSFSFFFFLLLLL